MTEAVPFQHTLLERLKACRAGCSQTVTLSVDTVDDIIAQLDRLYAPEPGPALPLNHDDLSFLYRDTHR